MKCDIHVPSARFTLRLVARTEVLFDNEIYQGGSVLEVQISHYLIFRSFIVNSRVQAVEQVSACMHMATNVVLNADDKLWEAKNFHIHDVSPLDKHLWEVVLYPAELERRSHAVELRLPEQ